MAEENIIADHVTDQVTSQLMGHTADFITILENDIVPSCAVFLFIWIIYNLSTKQYIVYKENPLFRQTDNAVKNMVSLFVVLRRVLGIALVMWVFYINKDKIVDTFSSMNIVNFFNLIRSLIVDA